MKEKSLHTIVDFFALVANISKLSGPQFMANLVEVYLSTQYSPQSVDLHLKNFNLKTKEYAAKRIDPSVDWEHFFNNEVEAQCYIISREVQASDRLLVLIYLLELSPYIFDDVTDWAHVDKQEKRFLTRVSELLKFSKNDYTDCLSFVKENFAKIEGQNQLLCITNNPNLVIPDVKVEYHPNLSGQMIFLRLSSVNTILFKASGDSRVEVNGHQIYKRSTNILKKGAIIQIDGISTIYFNDIEKALLKTQGDGALSLDINNIEYIFPGGKKGIKELSFSVKSGEMVAIMGGSGCGKTTLMKILIGDLEPSSGSVCLNQSNIHQNINKIKGYIGYVPQDDSLISELSAYENLFYNARLCLDKMHRDTLDKKVDELLKELGLYEAKNLKVGTANEKIISGGQRKRLNIAMELIRSPKILFLDEPTSGLSSADSENIMHLLKASTFSGKIVVVNIHQPSSEIFKLFDKLLFLDAEGHPVYFGRAAQVVSYLKKAMKLVDSHESECPSCGNLNPEDIFHLVQLRKLAPNGLETTERIYSPARWHRYFLRFWNKDEPPAMPVDQLPPLTSTRSNRIKQFGIYMVRNIKTKLADHQYLLLSLLLPPLLAFILAGFSRHSAFSVFADYVFGKNDNFPQFLLMSIIVALFMGMMSSSEEIIKEGGVLKRESFLGLSFVSYLLSKMVFLFALSGMQMWMYAWVSIHILDIPYNDLTMFYILWGTACFANSLGLLISSLFKTVAAVYVTIPFLLIPQILLSGAVIQFNKINPSFSSIKSSPIAADVMVAKWAYEALMVDLFLDNDYSVMFYDVDKPLHDIAYYRDFLCNEIEESYFNSESDNKSQTSNQINTPLINNGLLQLSQCIYFNKKHVLPANYNDNQFTAYLDSCRNDLTTSMEKWQSLKDSLLMEIGSQKLDSIKAYNFNNKVNDLVLAKDIDNKIKVEGATFIRRMSPIYSNPPEKTFRTQLFVPYKWFGNIKIATQWFNLIVIALFTFTNIVIAIVVRKYSRR